MNLTGKPTGQMSQSGLNLLRIVVASYFIGVALGLIHGTNVTILTELLLPNNLAQFTANTFVFIMAYLVLMGMWLRPAALLLATFVLANSGYLAALDITPSAMSDLWRDIALSSGLMMTYLQTSMRQARRQAIMRRIPQARRIKPGDKVQPRRVTPLRREDINPSRAILRPSPDGAQVVNIFAA